MQARAIDTSDIPGWGVDIDRTNDPTYPMRDRSGETSPDLSWTPPPAQPQSVEVLQSIEYIRRPAVFGTSTPPSGLSGMIRRVAFRYSESQWAHWLLLMLADRINSVEGVLGDFAHGRPPNLYREMGMASSLRHDREGVIAKSTITLALVAVAGIALGYHLTRPRRPKGLLSRFRH